MAIYSYNSKKDKIMDRWGDLINEKARKNRMDIDEFLTVLIKNGEKYYGDNFVSDLCKSKEEKDDFVDGFIDYLIDRSVNPNKTAEPARRFSRAITFPTQRLANSVQAVVKQKEENAKTEEMRHIAEAINVPQSLANAINAVVEKKREEEARQEIKLRPQNKEKQITKVETVKRTRTDRERQMAKDIDRGKYGSAIDFNFEPDEPIMAKSQERILVPFRDDGQVKVLPASQKKPVRRKATRKKAKSTLLNKIKEKFSDKSFRKKVLIGTAVIVVVAGIATVTMISQLVGADSSAVLSELTGNPNVEEIINQATNLTSNTTGQEVINYSGITEGHTIYENAYDATKGVNELVANQWVDSIPHDVYDVVNHEYLNLSNEQLNDPVFMKELMSNGNYSLLVGDGEVASGFISGEDFLKLIGQGRVK